MKVEEIREEDKRVIRGQLNRQPKGLIEVPVRCRFGFPVVLKTKPLIGGEKGDFEVFPTLYWLSCPRRSEKVSQIESGGYITQLEEALESDPELRFEYRRNEESYLSEQKELLTEDEVGFLRSKGSIGALERGIGGIKSDEHIKCLHLHLAHEIAGGNVIGRILRRVFYFTDCPPGKVRCKGFL
ncbi:MAG: DUF501 domain-containing protein [Candidatus Acetothermia bacterium]